MFFPLGGLIAGDPVGAYQKIRYSQQQLDTADIEAQGQAQALAGIRDYLSSISGAAPGPPGLTPAVQAAGRDRALGAPPTPQAPTLPVRQAAEGVEPMRQGEWGNLYLPTSAMRAAIMGPGSQPYGDYTGVMPGAQPMRPPTGGLPTGAPPGAAGPAAPGPLNTGAAPVGPQPGAGAPMVGRQFGGQMDLMGLVNSIVRANPEEKNPRVIMSAVNQAVKMMTPIAQAENQNAILRARLGDYGMDDVTIAELVDRRLAGDKSVLTNIGRGIQGGANLERFNRALANAMRTRGITGADLAKIDQQYVGETQYQRSTGTQGARVESASNEVEQLIPQALDASRGYPRGKWVPINKLQQMWDAGTSDPKYNDFLIANFSLINAYVRAMNPTGQPRITERLEAHALGILGQANSSEAYEVQVNRLWKEVQASKTAVSQTREGRKPGNINAPVPQPAQSAPVTQPQQPPAQNKPAKVIQNGHEYILQPDGSYK